MTHKIQFLKSIYDILPRAISSDVALFIASQFALESDFGKSSLAKNHHNLCGMCQPLRRVTYSIGQTDNGFARFLSDEDCVKDYLLWLAFTRRFPVMVLSDVDLFANRLASSGYCPEPDYIDRVFTIYNQYYGVFDVF